MSELMPVSITNALSNLNAMQPRFDRGYTGHSLSRFFIGEHMAGFGLINMNGRLYDPYLQRFLSPDNVIQEPENAQNYNRYSYCLNNPLMYTDPTGWTTQISLNAIYLSISSYASGTQFNSSTGYEFISNAVENLTDLMNLSTQEGGGDPFNKGSDKAYDNNDIWKEANIDNLTIVGKKKIVGNIYTWEGDPILGANTKTDPTIDKGGFVETWKDMAKFLIVKSRISKSEVSGYILYDNKKQKIVHWIHPWEGNTINEAKYNPKMYLPNYNDYTFLFSVHSHTSLDFSTPDNPSFNDWQYLDQSGITMIIIGNTNTYRLDPNTLYPIARFEMYGEPALTPSPLINTNNIYNLNFQP